MAQLKMNYKKNFSIKLTMFICSNLTRKTEKKPQRPGDTVFSVD